jgi:hypothetical protein
LLLKLTCRIGTLDALNCRMIGGFVPGGIALRIVWEIAATWATADAMSTFGWKKILITEMPFSVCDWMFRTSFTALEMVYSL